jgi:hypothetical protein
MNSSKRCLAILLLLAITATAVYAINESTTWAKLFYRAGLQTDGQNLIVPSGGTLAVGGSTGTGLKLVKILTLTYDGASTVTDVNTVAGVRVGDVVLVTPNTAYSADAYFKSAVPTANTITLTMSADPGTTVTYGGGVYRY